MLINLWNTVLYEPFVNLFATIVYYTPGGDLGFAVIILTILIKLLLFPLSQKSLESQAKMKLLEPEINKIKKSTKNKEEQAKLTFELYKKHKTNPFSGCLIILVQFPIIIALYYVFLKGVTFDSEILYSFVKEPKNINNMFLGFLDMSAKKVWLLAILAGMSQYFQVSLMPQIKTNNKENKETSSFQESFAKSMQLQMKYILPVFIAFFAYSVSGAIALYFVISNIFGILQQLYINKQNKNKENLILLDNKKEKNEQ